MRGTLLALGRPAMESPAGTAAAAAAGAGAPARHVLLLTLHHAIGDGWSQGLLVREMVAFYDHFAAGGDLPAAALPGVPALPIQYGDYAVWQRQWLRGEVLAAQLDYWRRQLADAPPRLTLPADRPRPAAGAAAQAVRRFTLPAGAARELRQLGRQGGGTLFMTLLAAWQVALARHAGQDDVVVGTPIAGRTRGETEDLIGFFINTLALRTRLAPRASFQDVLAQVRETTLGAYAHQDLPFERLVEELQPERALGHAPLFQVTLILQNAPLPPRPPAGLTLAALPETGTGAKFDLTLALGESAAGELGGVLDYNRELFDAATAERLLGAFLRLLRAAAAAPAAPVLDLDMLDAVQRHQLIWEWGRGQGGAAAPASHLHRLFEEQARRRPEAVAVVLGDRQLSYGELDRRAERLAGRLRALGARPDAPIGICAERALELIAGMLAVLKAGGAWLPLDPGYPADRLAFMAGDAGIAILLVDERGAAHSELAPAAVRVQLDGAEDPPAAPGAPSTRAALSGGGGAGGAGSAGLSASAGLSGFAGSAGSAAELPPDSAAYVIYTSGSTGRPKGVVVGHQAACRHMAWMGRALAFSPADRVLQRTSVSFDASVWEIWMPLAAGAALVLLPADAQGDAARLLATVEAQQVTVLQMVPSLLAAVLEEPAAAAAAGLRCLCCGAEPLAADVVQRFHELLGGPHGVQLLNLYGPTEATIESTWWRCADDQDAAGGGRSGKAGGRTLPIGRPIDGAEVLILDGGGRLVPPGVAGELHLSGLLARGYLERPDLTAARFVPHPYAALPGSRLYRTGDLGRMRADGAIEFLGRADSQVKLRGYRIELGEIEAALRAHPAVVRAAVAVRDDLPGGPRLVAYTVADAARGAAPPAAAELTAHLRQRLPEPMVPAVYVALRELPLSPNGKLDRARLPRPAAVGAAAGHTAPRDRFELQLAQIWGELVGGGAIGPADSFFALGGHSLLAVRLMNRIAAVFGQRLPVAALFESPTLEALAARLRRGAAEGGAARAGAAAPARTERRRALVHLHGDGPGTPLFVVHPVGGNVLCYWQLAHAAGAGAPVYGLQLPDVAELPASDGLAPAAGTVEALAAHYVAALGAVQPRGPYRLAGWSMGGVIAFEMARQLEHAGQPVALLALLDSYAPAATPGRRPRGAALVRQFAADLCGLLGVPATAPAPALPEDEAAALGALERYGREQGVLPADLDSAELGRLFQLFKTGAAALATYRPAPYRGGTVLLFAAQDTGGVAADPERGWRQLAPAGLDVRPVAGDHYAMVRQPAVGEIAAALRGAAGEQ